MLTLMFTAGVLFGGFGSSIPLEFSHILEQPSKHSNIWTGTHCLKMFAFFFFIGEAKQEVPLSKLTLTIILALPKDCDLFNSMCNRVLLAFLPLSLPVWSESSTQSPQWYMGII